MEMEINQSLTTLRTVLKKRLLVRKNYLYSIKFLLVLLGISGPIQAQVIPAPLKMQKGSNNFQLDQHTVITFSAEEDDLKEMIKFFQKQIKDLAGFQLPVIEQSQTLTSSERNGIKKITFEIHRDLALPEEGYQLKISENNIKVSAPTIAGVFYGIQTLLQYFPGIRTNERIIIPEMEITDEPAFAWRGMMLDVSRHFYSVETIKELLDLMSFYKLNTFHWHLTDNEGWRLEIKEYPKLTTIAAWRKEIPGSIFYKKDSTYIEPLDGEPYRYGGYYTQEQAREVVAYAAKRNITVIPEIEIPGHSAAALAAYPEFSCEQPEQDPPGSNLWNGVIDTDNMAFNYCAGQEASFNFLQDVLLEVMEIFPSKFIHIGGDEVDKSYWERCDSCQARMREENLQNEEELQSYFIRRIEKILSAHKRKLLGWDEILEGGLAPGATVMSWRGEKGGVAAAKSGHYVVMAPSDPLYFNRYQAGPYSINTLKKVYNYEPVPEALNKKEAKYVLGSQFAIWTEFISSVEHLEYMLLPRMAAFSEAVWSTPENKNFEDFKARLNQEHYDIWKQRGLRFHPEYYQKSEY